MSSWLPFRKWIRKEQEQKCQVFGFRLVDSKQEMTVAQVGGWLGDEELWLDSRYIEELEPTELVIGCGIR